MCVFGRGAIEHKASHQLLTRIMSLTIKILTRQDFVLNLVELLERWPKTILPFAVKMINDPESDKMREGLTISKA